jgi:KDO2-lipid IV(A) lauroyltransferase
MSLRHKTLNTFHQFGKVLVDSLVKAGIMQIRYFIEASIAKAILGSYQLVGLRAGSYLGSLVGRFLGSVVSEGKLAATNINRALPHLSAAQQAQVNKELWSNLGRVLGEFPHLDRIYAEADTRLIQEGVEHVEAVRRDGKPVIFISGHFGNWEMVIIGVQRLVGDTGAIYRRANNPHMEKWITSKRGVFMPIPIMKGKEGAREMLKLLKSGKPLAALIDQRLNTGDPIRFFNRDTRAPSAVVKLARKMDIPLIPTRVIRRDDGPDAAYFKQIFYPPIHVAQTDNMQGDIDATMREIYDYFEAWISERPAEWFWPHNRWGD